MADLFILLQTLSAFSRWLSFCGELISGEIAFTEFKCLP